MQDQPENKQSVNDAPKALPEPVRALAERMHCAALGATKGTWRVRTDGVFSEDASAARFADELRYYGGALIGESMRPCDRLHVEAAQPANVVRIVDAYRAAVWELEHLRALLADHRSSFEELRRYAADAVERVDVLLRVAAPKP